MGNTKTVSITEIHRPADLQMRESLRTDHINEMAEALKNGDDLPPVKVVQEGKTYWLWDGHHRVAAHETASIRKVQIEVTEQGDRKRARWLAYSANRDNTALKRSLEDRRKAVRQALEDAWDWSDRAIAEHVGVTHPMVSSMREDASGGKNASKSTTSDRTGKDGKQYPASKKATKKKTASKSQPPQSQADTDSDAYEEEGEGEGEPAGQPDKPAGKGGGKEVFGPKRRKEAKEKLNQFIRIAHESPDYEKRVRPHADKLMEWAKGS